MKKMIPRFNSLRSYVIEDDDGNAKEICFVIKEHPRNILTRDLQRKEVYIDDVKYKIKKKWIDDLLVPGRQLSILVDINNK